ncbi:HIRA-interacting protein 3, partial [Irineochytrium annulatum]
MPTADDKTVAIACVAFDGSDDAGLRKKLMPVIVDIIKGTDLENVSAKAVREKLAARLGLASSVLSEGPLKAAANQAIKDAYFKIAPPDDEDDEPEEEEEPKKKAEKRKASAPPKKTGARGAKAAKKRKDESEDEERSEAEDSDEEEKPKRRGARKPAAKSNTAKVESDEDDAEDDDDFAGSEEEENSKSKPKETTATKRFTAKDVDADPEGIQSESAAVEAVLDMGVEKLSAEVEGAIPRQVAASASAAPSASKKDTAASAKMAARSFYSNSTAAKKEPEDAGGLKRGKEGEGSDAEGDEEPVMAKKKAKVENGKGKKGVKKEDDGDSLDGLEDFHEPFVAPQAGKSKERGEGKKREAGVKKEKKEKPEKPAEKEEKKKGRPKKVDKEVTEGKISEKHAHEIERLKGYISKCGVKRRFANDLKDLPGAKRVAFLKKFLVDLGITGRPTLEACAKLKAKLELQRELAELDTGNIMFEDDGNDRGKRTRRSTRGSAGGVNVERRRGKTEEEEEEEEDDE